MFEDESAATMVKQKSGIDSNSYENIENSQMDCIPRNKAHNIQPRDARSEPKKCHGVEQDSESDSNQQLQVYIMIKLVYVDENCASSWVWGAGGLDVGQIEVALSSSRA
ncbi:hypothetical protein DFH06DRAFT_1146824 [Mycena polygramma]|nr:hypothetical protein DFH06DRAFT_1146824 [Mycena polygramma]